MRAIVSATVIAACTLGVKATAQTPPDPVLTAYHDYKAALMRKDLPAVESAAERALAASEERDGGGGVTAVLAMNLALARMDDGHDADAIAPARRALGLAEAGVKGVDPLEARLTIAEATLSTDPHADRNYGLAALRDADKRPSEIDPFAYSAAVALGKAAFKAKAYPTMQAAWLSAERHIPGPPSDEHSFLLAMAMIQEAAAFMGIHHDAQADEKLTAAMDILAPLAPETADEKTISAAEVSYADAGALRSAERSRLVSEGHQPPYNTSVLNRRGLLGRPNLCPGFVRPDPYPVFPGKAEYDRSVGAVVLKFRIDAKGNVLAADVISAVPDGLFRQSVSNPNIKWTYQISKSAPPGCRVETNDRLEGVVFTLK